MDMFIAHSMSPLSLWNFASHDDELWYIDQHNVDNIDVSHLEFTFIRNMPQDPAPHAFPITPV